MKTKRIKNLLCLLMVLTLLSGLLTGCRTKPENSNTTATTEEPSVTSSTTWNIHDGMVHPPIYDSGYHMSLVPDDPYYELGLFWSAERISLEDAWDLTTGSKTIRVGVIDSGIDASHPDLVKNINTELSESYVDGCSPLEDSVGHGTHVAGIIGAR